MSRLLRLNCLLGLALAFAAACPQAAVPINLAVNGADSNDGSTARKSVATLQTAIAKAMVLLKAGAPQVEVLAGPGVYRAQRAEIPALPNGKALLLQARPGLKARPVFDGAGKGGTWLLVRGGGERSGALQIAGLEVANYPMAISLAGNRELPERSVNNVTITGNVFRKIGQVALPAGEPATAAVRMVNSDHVTLTGNRFSQIRNLQRCRLMHAIYAAHGSTLNRIEGNRFSDSCGDPVHFRDRSGNNWVKDNLFQDAWAEAPVSDWYCDSGLRDDCTKASGECPSFDNLLEGNRMVAVKLPAVGLAVAFGADVTATCPAQGSGQRFVYQ